MQHHRRLAWVLFLSAFCGHIAPMMLPALAPGVAQSLGIPVSSVGATAGWMTFLAGCGGAVGGILLEGRERRVVTAAVLAACAAATACVGLSGSQAVFFAASAAAGACFGLIFFLALSAVPEFFLEADRPSATARVTSAMFLASLLGVPLALAVALVPGMSWRSSYFCVSGLCAMVALLVIQYFPRGQKIGGGNGLAAAWMRSSRRTLPRAAVGLLAVAALTRLGVGMYITYIPSFLVARRDFPESGFILTFAIPGALAFFATGVAGRVLAQANRRLWAASSAVIISAAVLAIVYWPAGRASIVPVVLAFSLIYAGAEAVRMTALNLMSQSQVTEELRPVFLGFYSLSLYYGYALGAIAGGVLMRSFDDQVAQGIPAVMWTAVAAWLCSGGILALGSLARSRAGRREDAPT